MALSTLACVLVWGAWVCFVLLALDDTDDGAAPPGAVLA